MAWTLMNKLFCRPPPVPNFTLLRLWPYLTVHSNYHKTLSGVRKTLQVVLIPVRGQEGVAEQGFLKN